MFTEITGNADLYAEAVCGCNVYCRQSCTGACMLETPMVVIRIDDLITFLGDESGAA